MNNYRTMKTIRVAILLIFILGAGACDYLDYDESSYLLEEDVFKDFSRTKQFLTGIYAYLPTGFYPIDGAMRSSASDDAIHVWKNSDIHKFNDGSWSSVQTLDASYASMYKGIRAVNKFLVETDGQEFEDQKYNEDYAEIMRQFKLYPYEARFLRAYFYFELTKRYASVPLITDVLTPDEANTVLQAPFDTLINYIVSECEHVADSLPISYDFITESENGRATRGAAMALKSRALLYAASPLHNPANSVERWALAADAAADGINLLYYSLEGNYSDQFNNPESVELILGRGGEESNTFERNNFPLGFEGGMTGTCPTQNLVDAYEMQVSGLAIDDPASGYDKNFPYQDRDPRFLQTILTNNSTWKGEIIETWFGGKNAQPKANASLTAYYLKKYLIESISLEPTNTTKKKHVWVLFRFGEVLLNYAEAMNEAYGPEDNAGYAYSAIEAVNMLRARAGMPDFAAGMSKAEFREKLRNERRVELAFEDHRFWDIRRWKIANSTTDIYGVLITDNVFGGYVYQKELLEERQFEDHMNLYPIPISEIYINDNLSQNTGW